MGADLEQWKRCLIKSIQLFCRNFCQYDQEAKIDGLLAITLDNKEVILVKLQEVDSDSSVQRGASKPSADQSELLESILRYLAPSCRLLKKTALAPTLPSIWQPVGEVPPSSDMPDRITFLRSLGLAPTALVANRPPSHPHRLRSKASLSVMATVSAICQARSNQKVIETPSSSRLVQPAASPRPGKVAAPLAKADAQRSCDGPAVTSAKTRREGVLELVTQPATSSGQKALPGVSVLCTKNITRTEGVDNQSDTKSNISQPSVRITDCMENDNVDRVKKSTSYRQTNSCCGGDSISKTIKVSNRPRKRTITSSTSSSPSLSGNRSKSSSGHEIGVKRAKLEAKQEPDDTDRKPDIGSIESARSTGSKRLANRKTKGCKLKGCKIKACSGCEGNLPTNAKGSDVPSPTSSKGGDAPAANSKQKRFVNSKSTLTRVTSVKKNEAKDAGKQLLNRSKARLKVLYTKTANTRKERVLKALRRARAVGCGSCAACKVKNDCRTCKYCLDMKRYGGPNKLHQKCRLRQCRLLKNQQKEVMKARREATQVKATTSE